MLWTIYCSRLRYVIGQQPPRSPVDDAAACRRNPWGTGAAVFVPDGNRPANTGLRSFDQRKVVGTTNKSATSRFVTNMRISPPRLDDRLSVETNRMNRYFIKSVQMIRVNETTVKKTVYRDAKQICLIPLPPIGENAPFRMAPSDGCRRQRPLILAVGYCLIDAPALQRQWQSVWE